MRAYCIEQAGLVWPSWRWTAAMLPVLSTSVFYCPSPLHINIVFDGRKAHAGYLAGVFAAPLFLYTGMRFPITCNAARVMVSKIGKMLGVDLRPHDLRRHAATCASRSGTPLEIVSKIILRHAHLATTQRYLGKVTDVEAMRWIENLYA